MSDGRLQSDAADVPRAAPADESAPEDLVAATLDSPEAGGAAIRGGAMRLVGYVVNVLLGALSAAFLFRHLGKRDAGTYVTAMTIGAIVGGLSDLGLTALGLRELSVRDPGGRRRLMSNLLGVRLALTIGGLAVSVVFAVAVGYSSLLVAGVALAGLGLTFQTVQGTLALSLMSRLKLGLVTVTEVARQALVTILTILLVLAGAGLLPLISIAIPVGVLLLAATVWLVRGEVPFRPRFDQGEWRLIVRAVLPYSAAAAISVVYFRVSVVIVSLTSSATELSYFGASFRILEVLILIPGLMVTAVFPIFARSALEDQERLAYAVSRVFSVALIAGVWFMLVIAIGAPFAIKVIGGDEFAKATDVLRIQGIGLGGSFVGSVWGLTLLSLRRNRALLAVNVAGLVVGTLLVVILAAAAGARGAAAGTAATELLVAFLTPLVLRSSDRHVLPAFDAVPRVLLAGGVAAATALIPGIPVLAAAVAATAVFGMLLLLTRTIPEELFVELRSLRAVAAGGFGRR